MGLLAKAARSALGGGIPGAIAMVLQVLLLMWLRTTVNFQMVQGMSTLAAMRFLYAEGGIPRFYRGLWAALLQGPLSRFGDTAANAGVLALLEPSGAPWSPPKTMLASLAAGCWRVVILPIDKVKTVLQVHGAEGMARLANTLKSDGVGSLYEGAAGATLATVLGHYPWFLTNNFLEKRAPRGPPSGRAPSSCGARASGSARRSSSDCVSNSMRVVKTYKQASLVPLTYVECARARVAAPTASARALLASGCSPRSCATAFRASSFSILWKMLMDRMNDKLLKGPQGRLWHAERNRPTRRSEQTRNTCSGGGGRPRPHGDVQNLTTRSAR